MRVIKKVNNNAAICEDGSGRQLVAFGKGIGFRQAPYEITDLSQVQRTFYEMSPQYIEAMTSLPGEVIEFAAEVVDVARAVLPYELSPNLLITLADHVSFAIRRARDGIYVKMPLAYDMEQMFPEEMSLGRQTLARMRAQFKVLLPKDEASGIALAFVNARVYSGSEGDVRLEEAYEAILEEITSIVEQEAHISIDRDSFNYARYATHVRYLLERLKDGRGIDSVNADAYEELRKEYPDTARCVDKVVDWLERERGLSVSDEEQLYLLLHVNRVSAS